MTTTVRNDISNECSDDTDVDDYSNVENYNLDLLKFIILIYDLIKCDNDKLNVYTYVRVY